MIDEKLERSVERICAKARLSVRGEFALLVQTELQKYAAARAAALESVLLSRHGGEPLALLSELDDARAKLAAAERERDVLRRVQSETLTAAQMRGIAQWMLKRCKLDDNAAVLTIQILERQADAIDAALAIAARSSEGSSE